MYKYIDLIGLMHDDVTSSKFTTKPRLYDIPLQTSEKFTLFLSGNFFQLCSFENTWMKLSQVYISKASLEG